jgi:hypothetical protein
VKQFVTINPSVGLLRGKVGEKVSQVITVASGTSDPLKILHTNTLNQDNFRYSMSEIEVDGKEAYEFLIENTMQSVGRYSDKIFIMTDNMELNPITILVRGDIRPAETEKQKATAAPSAPEEAKTH